MKRLFLLPVAVLLALSCGDEPSVTAPTTTLSGTYRVFAMASNTTCPDINTDVMYAYVITLRIEGDRCVACGMEARWDPARSTATLVGKDMSMTISFPGERTVRRMRPWSPVGWGGEGTEAFVATQESMRPADGCETTWDLIGIQVTAPASVSASPFLQIATDGGL